MAVAHVEVLVEEPSMEAALRELLPRLLRAVTFQVYRHQGKYDLLKQLPNRLRGYASWLPSDWRVVVVIDRDQEDCTKVKRQLEQFAWDAGLRTRACCGGMHYQVVNRIVVEELEAWFLGDWDAVRAAYPRVRRQTGYQNPDAVAGGTWEAFERILQKAGYFPTGLRKIEAARQIAKHWNPDSNCSHSFGVFRDAMRRLAEP